MVKCGSYFWYGLIKQAVSQMAAIGVEYLEISNVSGAGVQEVVKVLAQVIIQVLNLVTAYS